MTALNIAQVQHDFENGTLICRLTMGKVIALAMQAESVETYKTKRDIAAFIMSQCIHNMVVANQAAWIEWQHGKGAEAAMQWIENGLAGPGHVPRDDGTDAQAYFDANVDERMDPTPAAPQVPA